MAQTFPVVSDRARRPVSAKTLVDAFGNDVVDPRTGQALIVPNNYDIGAAITFGQSLGNISRAPTDESGLDQRAQILDALGKSFQDSGPQDLQRTYNNVVGGGKDEFVGAFTPAASFHLGVVGRAAGLTRAEIMAGGGLYNLSRRYHPTHPNPNIDTSGLLFNNPENARWIDEGIKAYDSGRLFKRTPSDEPRNGVSQASAMQRTPLSPGDFGAGNVGNADLSLSWPAQSNGLQQAAPPSGLPPHVIEAGNLLRANGYEITPRTMYLAHVLGPQAAVDLINRTGSTASPAVPSADRATGDQMRAWVRALRLGPAEAGIAGGMTPAPAAGPATPDQSSAGVLDPTQSFA